MILVETYNIKSINFNQMKNIIKLFFSNSVLFLVSFLALLSCDSNKDRYESYNFYAEVTPLFKEELPANEDGAIEIVIKSDNYKVGINHEVSYTGSKNSVLIDSSGNIINKGSTFVISDVDKQHIYKFRSEDIGEHNLKFNFKNSKGYTFTQARVVKVKK